MEIFKKLTILALSLLLSITSLLLVLLYFLIVPYRLLVTALAKLFRPDLGALVANETGYFFLRKPNLSIVSYFWVLDGGLPLSRLQRLVSERILEKKGPDGSLVFQRLREFPSTFMGFDVWEKDRDFKLSNHVKRMDMSSLKDYLGTPEANKEVGFEKRLEKLLNSTVAGKSSWEKGRSQWEMLLGSFPQMGNKTVFGARFQHALSDGHSQMFIFECLFQCRFKQQPKKSPSRRRAQISDISLRDLLSYPLRMAWETAEGLYMIVKDDNRLWQANDVNSVECFVAYSKRIRIEDIKGIRKRCGVEYGTVLYWAIGQALSRVMREAGQKLPPYTSLFFIESKDNHPKVMTNHFYCNFVDLNSKETNSIQQFNVKVLKAKKNLFAVYGDIFVAKILLSFPILLKQVQDSLTVDPTILISSFISCDATSFDGYKILDMIPFLGYRPSRTGAEIYVAGALDNVRISIVLSRAVAPDAEAAQRLVDYAWEELQSLLLTWQE